MKKYRKWVVCFNVTYGKYTPEWMVNYNIKPFIKSDSYDEIKQICDKLNGE